MDADGGGAARRLTTGADDLQPSWSSAGLIAYERRAASSAEIWVVDPTGGGASARITSADGGGTDPAWSPDGRRIAFTRRVDGVSRIFVVDADGQSHLDVVTAAAACACDAPTWSPDGSQLAYVGPGAERRDPPHPGDPVRWRFGETGHNQRPRAIVGRLTRR